MFARLCVFPPSSDCLYSPPSWSPHMWADISPPRMWEAAAPGSWSPQWGSPGTCVHGEVTAPLASAGGDVDTPHAGWNNPPQRATAGSAVPTASARSSPDCRGKRAEGVCSSGPPWCCCCSECSIAGLPHTGSLHSSAQPHRRNSLTRTQHSAMSSLSCFYQRGPMKELSGAVCSYFLIPHTIPYEPPSAVRRCEFCCSVLQQLLEVKITDQCNKITVFLSRGNVVVFLSVWFGFHPTVAHNSHPQNGESDLRSHLIKNAWHCSSVGFNGPIIARTNSN